MTAAPAFGINLGDAGPSKVKAALQAKLCHALQKQTGLALLPQRSKRTALQELNCAMSSKSNWVGTAPTTEEIVEGDKLCLSGGKLCLVELLTSKWVRQKLGEESFG